MPPTMVSSDLLSLWYQALHSPHGIVVFCGETPPERVRQKLYQVRTASTDEDLTGLSVCFSPSNNFEIWIVKK